MKSTRILSLGSSLKLRRICVVCACVCARVNRRLWGTAAETSGARGMFRNAPGYSVASNIRSEVAPGADPDEPGPGFYKVSGKEIQDVVKNRAATTKFGKDTNRSTFMTMLPYPGPGTYDQHIPQSQKAGAFRSHQPHLHSVLVHKTTRAHSLLTPTTFTCTSKLVRPSVLSRSPPS